jgi:hypothetical protein
MCLIRQPMPKLLGACRPLGGAGPSRRSKGISLVEGGAQTMIDAGLWPYHCSERVGGLRLLRSVTPDMLVRWDRGFRDDDLGLAVCQRGAQVLSRLPAPVPPQRVRSLPAGAYRA